MAIGEEGSGSMPVRAKIVPTLRTKRASSPLARLLFDGMPGQRYIIPLSSRAHKVFEQVLKPAALRRWTRLSQSVVDRVGGRFGGRVVEEPGDGRRFLEVERVLAWTGRGQEISKLNLLGAGKTG